jgi:hypothetical protein
LILELFSEILLVANKVLFPASNQKDNFMSAISRVASGVASSITRLPLPLPIQKLAINAMPVGFWTKSQAYQQCLANRIIARYGAVVQGGPFKGLKYISAAEDGCLVPKLLGCYEEELSGEIERFISKGYDRVIDVGCASGYFLTGLAYRQPKAEAYGFDTDEPARSRCAQNIAFNGLGDRVKLGGFCTPEHLNSLIVGRTLIIVDCEGGEFEVLNPAACPNLANTDVIVELHDFINDKITGALTERFRNSHAIEIIKTRDRKPDVKVYPGLDALPQSDWSEALSERRPCLMEWMILRSRAGA